ENDAIRFWESSEPGGNEVAILSFKSKGNTLGPDVLEGIIESVARAERDYKGLVIWQPKPPFSYGANLKGLEPLLKPGDFDSIAKYIGRFQQMTKTIKYSQVPVVAGVSGMALGGGCEVVMH